jgi:hypothetical protein
MKILNVILKIVLVLIIAMPIAGALGVFPPPTPDLYNTPEAFNFINILMTSKYIPYLNALIYALCIVLIIVKRTALAALLMLPINVNVIAFHFFLDGGLLTAGAALGNVLLLLNLYFLWQSRAQYAALWDKEAQPETSLA